MVSGGTSSNGGGSPTNSYEPASQRPFCGRSVPRWSRTEHGCALESMARLPHCSAWVSVGPPLSASAHRFGSPRRSRTPSSIGLSAVSFVTARKQVFLAPVSRFPPSDRMYQSQLPPWRLPPTIEFLRMTDELAAGGTGGAKSDS